MPNCRAPLQIEGYDVRCRKCPPCRQTHVDSWVLSCMAEAKTALETWTITLTYRNGEIGADFLRYGDVQRMFKRLRKAGHQFRYLCAGELGGEKGRPHWHLILFFQTPPPHKGKVIGRSDCGTYERRDWGTIWPHGHVVIDPAFQSRNVRYVCKYIQKADGHAGKFTASKRPGIGQTYFDQHATEHAKNLAPRGINEFICEGWRASLSPNRWRRYRELAYATLVAMGKDMLATCWPAYQNILTPDQRIEFEDWQFNAKRKADQEAPTDVVMTHRKGQESVVTYRRDGQYFMKLNVNKNRGAMPWLTGKFHLSHGKSLSVADLSGLTQTGRWPVRVLTVAIDNEQLGAIRQGKKPLPASNPSSRSDWLTDHCQALRDRLRISSAASKVRGWSKGLHLNTPLRASFF